MEVHEPSTLAEATDLLRHHGDDAKLVSGGTALVILLQQGLISPRVLVATRRLSDIEGFSEIVEVGQTVRIGGAVTLAEVASDPVVRSRAPSLGRAADLVGNVRVRNAATLGGALAEADYASDIPAALVNLGAEVQVSNGSRTRSVPGADFFVDFFTTALAPDEVVTHVVLPVPPAGFRSSYVKFSSRSAEDRPCVVVAASKTTEGGGVQSVDVVVGAIGPTPFRAPDVLASAVGEVLDPVTIATLVAGYEASCEPIDDLRGSSWYRREIVAVLVGRALTALREGGDDE